MNPNLKKKSFFHMLFVGQLTTPEYNTDHSALNSACIESPLYRNKSRVSVGVTMYASLKNLYIKNTGVTSRQKQRGTDMLVDINKVTKGTYQVVCEGINTRWVTTIIKK